MQTATLTEPVPQLPQTFIDRYKTFQVPWGPLGQVTYKRTYSRPIVPPTFQHIDSYHEQLKQYRNTVKDPDAQFPTEDWWQTSARCVNWYLRAAKGAVSVDEGMALYDDMMNLRSCFSGRALWQCGTATVDRLGMASLCNCYFVNVDSITAFLFTFDMLMLGGGVGFNIQKEFVFAIPKVQQGRVVRRDTADADFIVPDSREGWIELLRRVFDVYFMNKGSLSYSTICIRPAGSPISGFGGVASGPGPLCSGIADICKVLDKRVGKKLRPIDCLDIMNIIGSIVVAGNVRRSAELALGDHEDTYFLEAKRFDLKEPVPNWRAMSNNSIACSKFEHIPSKFWATYEVGGEPYGLVNLNLSRETGRTNDRHRKDPNASGTNPCGEITLEHGESCNLAEIFVPNIRDAEEFRQVAGRIWKVCKVIASLPHHWDFADKVISRNMRTGLGCTGVLQAPYMTEKDYSDTYEYLRSLDKEFSAQLGAVLGRAIPESIKLTTVKPSGTLSLLAGTSPGIHPEYAPFYIRRIRVASNSFIVTAARQAGYTVEPVLRFDGTKDLSTSVVEFPVKARPGSVIAADMTAIDQLEVTRSMQSAWSDNSVSVTVYFRKEELPAIKQWLSEHYDNEIKTVSFLLHSDHGFVQAPYEEISEKEFERRTKHLKPLDLRNGFETLEDLSDCGTGACPVR